MVAEWTRHRSPESLLRCCYLQHIHLKYWHGSSMKKEHCKFIGAFEPTGTQVLEPAAWGAPLEAGYSSRPLFVAVTAAPKRDKVACSSAGTVTLDLSCSPHLEWPRLCHHLEQKGRMSSGDITSLSFAAGSGGAILRYMSVQRWCLNHFLLGFNGDIINISRMVCVYEVPSINWMHTPAALDISDGRSWPLLL